MTNNPYSLLDRLRNAGKTDLIDIASAMIVFRDFVLDQAQVIEQLMEQCSDANTRVILVIRHDTLTNLEDSIRQELMGDDR